jgi:EpsI family protein
MMKFPSARRFIFAVVVIAFTAILLEARGRVETIVSHQALSSFPTQLGPWSAKDLPLDQQTLDVLGPGDFLLREYHDPSEESKLPFVDLFIAYFPSQRTGDTIHSPKHCLPGSGWTPDENARVTLALPGHSPFPANRYVVSRGEDRELVVYWYWAHDRGVASEYWAKFYLVKDAIEMNRSDGALVRLTTAMLPGENAEAARQRLQPFAAEIVPLLDTYIPR